MQSVHAMFGTDHEKRIIANSWPAAGITDILNKDAMAAILQIHLLASLWLICCYVYQTQNLRLLARVVVVYSYTKALFGVHV